MRKTSANEARNLLKTYVSGYVLQTRISNGGITFQQRVLNADESTESDYVLRYMAEESVKSGMNPLLSGMNALLRLHAEIPVTYAKKGIHRTF